MIEPYLPKGVFTINPKREADKLIEAGQVKVNGKVVSELGYKINPRDKVTLRGRPVVSGRPVYILLNKPKDYITTSKDPEGRRTVMFLLKDACRERVFY